MGKIKRILVGVIMSIRSSMLRSLSPIVIDGIYGGFWQFRERKLLHTIPHKLYKNLYMFYMERCGCCIGPGTAFSGVPILPHWLHGIFISDQAKIGKNVVIYQHVTIGSNTLKGHPRCGSPVIGDNVFIGAGAKIIGKVTIGDNCRIGANCVVVKDMPPNTTAVAAPTRFITSSDIHDNTFVPIQDFIQNGNN